jgi:hypothetical protein
MFYSTGPLRGLVVMNGRLFVNSGLAMVEIRLKIDPLKFANLLRTEVNVENGTIHLE